MATWHLPAHLPGVRFVFSKRTRGFRKQLKAAALIPAWTGHLPATLKFPKEILEEL